MLFLNLEINGCQVIKIKNRDQEELIVGCLRVRDEIYNAFVFLFIPFPFLFFLSNLMYNEK